MAQAEELSDVSRAKKKHLKSALCVFYFLTSLVLASAPCRPVRCFLDLPFPGKWTSPVVLAGSPTFILRTTSKLPPLLIRTELAATNFPGGGQSPSVTTTPPSPRRFGGRFTRAPLIIGRRVRGDARRPPRGRRVHRPAPTDRLGPQENGFSIAVSPNSIGSFSSSEFINQPRVNSERVLFLFGSPSP